MKITLFQKLSQRIWLVPILLIAALFLPLIGESIQKTWIGNETVCCMPDNYEVLYEKARVARAKRPLSNLIIGGSMIIALGLSSGLAVFILYYFYYSIKEKKSNKIICAIILLSITIYIITILSLMLSYYITYTDRYFQLRPWPGGELYDGAWYKPSSWL